MALVRIRLMKPNRYGFYNLVEFSTLLEKIHDDMFSLGDLLNYHRSGLPFYFHFNKLITNDDPFLKEHDLFLIQPELLKENKRHDSFGCFDQLKYITEYENDVQISDKKWIHKNIGYLKNSTDLPPYLIFSTYGMLMNGEDRAYIVKGRYYETPVLGYPAQYDEWEKGDSPYHNMKQPIMVDCNDVFININDCSNDLIPANMKKVESNKLIKDAKIYTEKDSIIKTTPLKGKPETTKTRILEELEEEGLSRDEPLPFGAKDRIAKRVAEASGNSLKIETIKSLFYDLKILSSHNTKK